MYELKVKSGFSAAHFLREYKGKCENLHGHNWNVEVIVSGKNLDNTGLLIDFKEIKNKLEEVMNTLDHKLINEIDYFKKHNPSCENIACYIFNILKNKFGENIKLSKVSVWETETSCATYFE
jgi:6-pyruvoyltetrahydropterin/6-carboxytetrahydropterin synthase